MSDTKSIVARLPEGSRPCRFSDGEDGKEISRDRPSLDGYDYIIPSAVEAILAAVVLHLQRHRMFEPVVIRTGDREQVCRRNIHHREFAVFEAETIFPGVQAGSIERDPMYSMSEGVTSSFTGLNVSETFNSRLQPNEIKASSTAGNALDLTYKFVDANNHNAGHVYAVTNVLNSSRSQSFGYDQLNRITSATTTTTTGTYCWGYTYSYDAWGNLLSQAGASNYSTCTETTMAVTADGNNHISSLSYDGSGDTLGDGRYSYTWNAEGEMKSGGGVNAPSDEKDTMSMAETYEKGHEENATICSPACEWSVGGGAKQPFDSMYVTQGNDFVLDKRFMIDNKAVQVYDVFASVIKKP